MKNSKGTKGVKKTKIEELDPWEVDFIRDAIKEKCEEQRRKTWHYTNPEEEYRMRKFYEIQDGILRKLSYLPKVKLDNKPIYKF